MAKTPEGAVKAEVKKIIASVVDTYVFMPVQSGMGKRTLDFLGIRPDGAAFAVETKKPGARDKITEPQKATAREIMRAKGVVFVIDSLDGPDMALFYRWLSNSMQENDDISIYARASALVGSPRMVFDSEPAAESKKVTKKPTGKGAKKKEAA